MALKNVGSFQYLMYKRYNKKQIWSWKTFEGPPVFNTRDPKMGLENAGLFGSLFELDVWMPIFTM